MTSIGTVVCLASAYVNMNYIRRFAYFNVCNDFAIICVLRRAGRLCCKTQPKQSFNFTPQLRSQFKTVSLRCLNVKLTTLTIRIFTSRTIAQLSVYCCLFHCWLFGCFAHSCWPISARNVGVVELLSMTSNEILYGRETFWKSRPRRGGTKRSKLPKLGPAGEEGNEKFRFQRVSAYFMLKACLINFKKAHAAFGNISARYRIQIVQ